MGLILFIAFILIIKDSGIKSELKLVKELFNKVSRKQAIIETSVLLGCLAVIVYGFGFLGLAYGIQ